MHFSSTKCWLKITFPTENFERFLFLSEHKDFFKPACELNLVALDEIYSSALHAHLVIYLIKY